MDATEALAVLRIKVIEEGSEGLGKIHAGLTAVTAAAALVGAALVESVAKASSFQQKLDAVGASAGLSERQLNSFRDGILAISDSTGIAVGTLADASRDLLNVGYRGAEALTIMRGAAEQSKITHEALAAVVGNEAGAFRAFGLTAAQVSRGIDEMTVAVGHGGGSFADMGAALSKVGPIAQSTGISFGDVTAALATLGAEHIKMRFAATGLQTILSDMVNPTKNLEKEAEKLGTTWHQLADDHGKGLIGILENIDKAARSAGAGTDGYTGSLLKLLGNKNTVTDFLGLAQNGFSSLAEHVKRAGDSAGATQKQFDEVMKGFGESVGRLLNLLQNFGIRIGLDVLPALTKFADWLGTNIPIAFKGISDAIGPVVASLSTDLKPAFEGVKAAAELAGTALGGLGGALGAIGKWLDAHGVGSGLKEYFALVAVGITAMAVAMGLFAAATAGADLALGVFVALANPISLVGIAVIAVGAAFVLAYEKIKPFHDAVDLVIASLGTAAGKIGEFVSKIADLVGHFADIVKGSDSAIASFHALGDAVGAGFKIASDAVSGFVTVVQDMLGIVRAVLATIADLFQGNWSKVLTDLGGLKTGLVKLWDDIQSAANKFWKDFWDAIGTLARDGVKILVAIVKEALPLVLAVFAWLFEQIVGTSFPKFLSDVKSFFGGLGAAIGASIAGGAGGVWSGLTALWDKFTTWMGQALDGINTWAGGIPGKIAGWIGDRASDVIAPMKSLGEKIGQGILDGIKSVLSAFNPMDWIGGGSSGSSAPAAATSPGRYNQPSLDQFYPKAGAGAAGMMGASGSLGGTSSRAPASIANSYPQVAQYWPLIVKYAELNHIDPFTLAALMAQESSGNINAQATWNAGEHAWDYGLFQYGPPEAASVGGQYGPNVSAEGQIATAAAYLAKVGLGAWNGPVEAGQVSTRSAGWSGGSGGFVGGIGTLPTGTGRIGRTTLAGSGRGISGGIAGGRVVLPNPMEVPDAVQAPDAAMQAWMSLLDTSIQGPAQRTSGRGREPIPVHVVDEGGRPISAAILAGLHHQFAPAVPISPMEAALAKGDWSAVKQLDLTPLQKKLAEAMDGLVVALHDGTGGVKGFIAGEVSIQKSLDRWTAAEAESGAIVGLILGNLSQVSSALGTMDTLLRNQINAGLVAGQPIQEKYLKGLAKIADAQEIIAESGAGVSLVLASLRGDLSGMASGVAAITSILMRQWTDALMTGSHHLNALGDQLKAAAVAAAAVVTAQAKVDIAYGMLVGNVSKINSGLTTLLTQATDSIDLWTTELGRARTAQDTATGDIGQLATAAITAAGNLGSLSKIISALQAEVGQISDAAGTEFARTGSVSSGTAAAYTNASKSLTTATWDQVGAALSLTKQTHNLTGFYAALGNEITLQEDRLVSLAATVGVNSDAYKKQAAILGDLRSEYEGLGLQIAFFKTGVSIAADKADEAAIALGLFNSAGIGPAEAALAGMTAIINVSANDAQAALESAAQKAGDLGDAASKTAIALGGLVAAINSIVSQMAQIATPGSVSVSGSPVYVGGQVAGSNVGNPYVPPWPGAVYDPATQTWSGGTPPHSLPSHAQMLAGLTPQAGATNPFTGAALADASSTAYSAGYAAYGAGSPYGANPYNAASPDGISWAQGWNAARYDALQGGGYRPYFPPAAAPLATPAAGGTTGATGTAGTTGATGQTGFLPTPGISDTTFVGGFAISPQFSGGGPSAGAEGPAAVAAAALAQTGTAQNPVVVTSPDLLAAANATNALLTAQLAAEKARHAEDILGLKAEIAMLQSLITAVDDGLNAPSGGHGVADDLLIGASGMRNPK